MKSILTRLALTLPVVWVVVSLVFLLIHLVPGDPVQMMLGEGAAPGDVATLRHDLGLDGTLPRAQIHPDNLWALRGLLDCLKRPGESAETALIRQRVDLAAARADLPVSVSCFCARGKAA